MTIWAFATYHVTNDYRCSNKIHLTQEYCWMLKVCDSMMPCRLLVVAFLTIIASVEIVMVSCKDEHGHSRRRDHPEKYCVTEVVREHAFPAHCMPAARPVSKAVRHPSVPLSNESRAELRKPAHAGNYREREARHLASEKNQVMDELLARPDILSRPPALQARQLPAFVARPRQSEIAW